ncbi:MAG TPA: acyltransferase [Micromonosporaceae bacterium]|jgi:acetyltransferase-like isoleucine patch superfamily enzyme
MAADSARQAASGAGEGRAIPVPGTDNPYNPLAWFVGEPDIGEGTWIGPYCLIDGSGGLTIGRGCDISAGVHVYTHSSALRCITARSQPIERRRVRIGNFTFIGANAVVLMGVTIGDHCMIGAGAVVTHDIPDRSLALGVPARVVGSVDPTSGSIAYDR